MLTVELTDGPATIVAGPAPDASGEPWADVEHLATLPSGGELWVVDGATDLTTWVRGPARRAARRDVGLGLARLGLDLHARGLGHGGVEAALVVVSEDDRAQLLPWLGAGTDDGPRLHVLGLSVLATAADAGASDGFSTLGLLAPSDLRQPGDGARWGALAELAQSRRAAPDLRYVIDRLHEATVALCRGHDPPGLLDPDVRFSAFHPRSAPIDEWSRLLVLAHRGGEVTTQAGVRAVTELIDEVVTDHFGPEPAPARADAAHAVPIDADERLTIAVRLEGAEIDHDADLVRWVGPVEEAVFWFHPEAGVERVEGVVEVFVGPILRSRIALEISVGDLGDDDAVRHTAAPYRDVFVSYAHSDREVVDAVTRYNSLGDRFLIDAEELRAGEDWRERLGVMIDEAEVFQLFWSEASARSAEVEVEWRRALEQRPEPHFIRPVYWQRPMPAPPAALHDLHFQHLLLDDLDPRPEGRARAVLAAAPSPTIPTATPAPPPPRRATPPGSTPRPSPPPLPPAPARSRRGWRSAPRAGLVPSIVQVSMVLATFFGLASVDDADLFGFDEEAVISDVGTRPGDSDDDGDDGSDDADREPLPPTSTTSPAPSTTPTPTTSPVPSTTPTPTPSPVPSTIPTPTTSPVPSTTSQTTTSSTPSTSSPERSATVRLDGEIVDLGGIVEIPAEILVEGGPLAVSEIVVVARRADYPASRPETPLRLEPGVTALTIVVELDVAVLEAVVMETDLGPLVLDLGGVVIGVG